MIKVDNLKKTYDKGTKRANEVLHNLSFQLPDTGFVCILGASGSGKTSLLNAIGGLDVYDSGTITTETAEIKKAVSKEMEKERNANFGYIFQNYYLLTEHSVAYNVYLGMHSLDLPHSEKLKRVKDALSRVDMLRYRKRPVGELSGGQQQRVAIARAIARKPRVIFADEPTGNLDESNTMNICTILKELSKESLVVMVTHETRIAEFFADRIITLERGVIVSDKTEWERGIMDAGEKNTVYTGDYKEETVSTANLSVRMLASENAEPVELTVVAEKDRIILKFNDQRIVLSSDVSHAPFVKEGAHPVYTQESFNTAILKKTSESNENKSVDSGKTKKFLGFGFLFSEAKSSISRKKLQRFGLGLFIIILCLIISISIADYITISHIDPEDFIATDSHALHFEFKKGPNLDQYVHNISPIVAKYIDYINSVGYDIDYLPIEAITLKYLDNTVPQFKGQEMTFPVHSLADLERLDESTLIAGRMPENYTEIIVDRWVIDKALEEDGVLQNFIPNAEYLLGKTLDCEDRNYSPTIVGICDSGEPSIYMSKEGLLAIGHGGYEIITLSEYKRLTDFDPDYTLEMNECIAIFENTKLDYNENPDKDVYITLRSMTYSLLVKDTVSGVKSDMDIEALIVVRDDVVDDIYASMIPSEQSFVMWAKNKESIKEFLNKPLPEELDGLLTISVTDNHNLAYNAYLASVNAKKDGRVIIFASVILLSFVMLYLMQRSKIKERMDLITVYRLLGVPKRNLMVIFALESLLTTIKFGLPTEVLLYFGIILFNGREAAEEILIFPFWAAMLALGAIALVRLVFAMIPILTLNRKPPARLAANYDF